MVHVPVDRAVKDVPAVVRRGRLPEAARKAHRRRVVRRVRLQVEPVRPRQRLLLVPAQWRRSSTDRALPPVVSTAVSRLEWDMVFAVNSAGSFRRGDFTADHRRSTRCRPLPRHRLRLRLLRNNLRQA
jgi:hypothetical protein